MRLSLAFLTSLFFASSLTAADLVIAENKACDYKIVVPEKSGDVYVDGWLMLAARVSGLSVMASTP